MFENSQWQLPCQLRRRIGIPPYNSKNIEDSLYAFLLRDPHGHAPLFRQEATDALASQWAGSVVLARPISMRLGALISTVLALGICVYLILGEYTRRVHVSGQIAPSAGSIRVTTDQLGLISSKLVKDGEMVERGQSMFELSAERFGREGSADARIKDLLKARRNELIQMRELQTDELRRNNQALAVRQRSIEAEIMSRKEQILLQDAQVQSARDKVSRYSLLTQQGYLAPAQLNQARDEVNVQLANRKGLESALQAVERDLLQLTADKQAITGKINLIENQVAQNLSALGQEIVQQDGRSRFFVTAPASGIVSAIAVDTGQTVQAGEALATVLPSDGKLVAQLMLPSRAVGFIETGQEVHLRLSAFAYQKFGQVTGTVVSVDRSPLRDGTPSNVGPLPEPLYRVTVNLSQQAVTAYGRKHQFKAGMTLEADILQDRRRLVEWLFDPLISSANVNAR